MTTTASERTSHRPPHPLGRQRPANPAVRAFITGFGVLFLVATLVWFSLNAGLSGPRWHTSTLGSSESMDGVEQVRVSSSRANVTVSDTSNPGLTWTATMPGDPANMEANSVVRSGGTLTIEPEAARRIWFLTGFSWGWDESGTLDVAVPSAPELDLHISTRAGDANAGGTWDEVVVTSGVGDVILGVSARSMDIRAGVGDIRGSVNVDGGPLTINGGVGDISLTISGGIPSAVDVTAGVGDVALNLPPTTHGYVVTGDAGAGGRTNLLPAPDPDGIPVSAPVRVKVSSGVGSVVLGTSGS
ncbi:MAG: DUF4097 family beta strand repeat-containing protein [bacterium]|nr:DUF4097 family beta strand repeat-containing protein [bacterium]